VTNDTPARALRPLVAMRRGWRRHLRDAYERCGHSQDSLAAALGWPQQHVARLLSRASGRVLNLDHLESLRDDPATRDAWLLLLKLHALEGGVVLEVSIAAPASKTGSDER
jgi:hypothetical protein